MFGRKKATIKLLEREINEMRKIMFDEKMKSNELLELVKKTYVSNFFYGDKYIYCQPEWIKKDEAVKFLKWDQKFNIETCYANKYAAKFYRSAITEWNKQATIEKNRQKNKLRKTNKQLKIFIQQPPHNHKLYGV